MADLGAFFSNLFSSAGNIAIGILFLVMVVIFGLKFIGQQKADIAADPDLGNASKAYDAAVTGEAAMEDVGDANSTIVAVAIMVIVIAALILLKRMNNTAD